MKNKPAAHTPGPWRHADNMIQGQQLVRILGDSKPTPCLRNIAMIVPANCATRDLDAQAQANARLIAAAPELLNTLKQIAKLGYYSHGTIERDLVEAAIAKAEGRE